MEENKPILIDFINTILLDSEFDPVVDLKILNPFNLKEGLDDKESILDVKAENKAGRVFDVEIQVIGNASFVKRSLYSQTSEWSGTTCWFRSRGSAENERCQYPAALPRNSPP